MSPGPEHFREPFDDRGEWDKEKQRYEDGSKAEPALKPPCNTADCAIELGGTHWHPPGRAAELVWPELGPTQRYQDALAAGLSDHEAREEGWPQPAPPTATELQERIARTLDYIGTLARLPHLDPTLERVLEAVHASLSTPMAVGTAQKLIYPKGIEQARRDFMQFSPTLYRYIEARIQARTWDDAGDLASGALSEYGAANRCYAQQTQFQLKAETMRAQFAPVTP
jgi:hypothetical protein